MITRKHSLNHRKKQPPPFHDTYYKIRNRLSIFAGLLLAWEIAGLEKDDHSKPILPYVNLKFSDNLYGDGIPIVLALGTCFLMIRYYNEWKQSNQTRRVLIASRFDRFYTLLISSLAVLIFLTNISFEFKIYQYWEVVVTSVAATLGLYRNQSIVLIPYNYIFRGEGDRNLAVKYMLFFVVIIILTITLGLFLSTLSAGGGPNMPPPEGNPPL